jgi:hypothetical protein
MTNFSATAASAVIILFSILTFPSHAQEKEEECGIWFAESSIPNSGIGMFAGREFVKDEPMTETGDVVIPIVDIKMYQGDKWTFLFDEYTCKFVVFVCLRMLLPFA